MLRGGQEMRRIIFAAALLIAGAIGLAIVSLNPISLFRLVLAVIFAILFILGLVLGLSAICDNDHHHDDC
jgi:hypothetical protein